MDLANPFGLALAIVGAGAGLIMLTLIGRRLVPAWIARPTLASPIALPVDTESDAAVLIAQTGGEVVFANERAHAFFELNGLRSSVMALARQAQPADTFLQLFAIEGTARLQIREHTLEATSLRLPSDDPARTRTVLFLRETDQFPELAAGDERTAQAMSVITEVSRAIAASLDLADTFDAILANVGRVFQFDIAEINLWDPDSESLRPAQYAGERSYELRLAQAGESGYKAGEGFSGLLLTRRQPLLVPDIETFVEARPKLASAEFPFRSYVGVPLLVGPQLVGTLELISYRPDAYKPGDLLLLNAIAGQAAIAIQNAQLFAAQQRRVAELTGLADITRAIESTADARELYGRLTADIARLMDVQMAGFLLHSESDAALISAPPFFGVPDLVTDAYRLPITPGSATERLWLDNTFWLSNNVLTDPLVAEMGLRDLAEITGVRATLMAPIAAGGKRLGVIQVSNKVNGAPFNDQDTHLLTVFASQCAAILENARLVSEARERVDEAEGLRELATIAAAGTNLDVILPAAMAKAATLISFEIGLVALLDEARGELIPHAASIFGDAGGAVEAGRIRTDDPQFNFSVTRLRKPFMSNRAQRDRRIGLVYRPLIDAFGIQSVMDVPLVVGDRALGEMMVAARREGAFSRADRQLLATIGATLASAIERARLYAATDQNLQRRVDQLTALTRVGRELNQTLELERILRLVHREVLAATRADRGVISLLDLAADPPTAVSRLGNLDLPPELDPVEQDVIAGAHLEQIRRLEPGTPLASAAEARSALLVPIISQDAVVGLIRLDSRQPDFFDDTAVETAVSLAAQTAIAIANAQRYDEQRRRGELLRLRADQLAQLFQISRTVRTDQPLDANLEAVAFGLQEAVGFNVVLVAVLDPHTRTYRFLVGAGVPVAAFEAQRGLERPWEIVRRLQRPEQRVSQSFLLPAEAQAKLALNIESLSLSASRTARQSPNAWQDGDLLMAPLLGSRHEPVGLLVLDDPRDGSRPDRNTIEVVEIFANQAVLAIENTRLFLASERRAERLLALHRVIERASAISDRTQLWTTVAEALVREMSFDLCLIALGAPGRLVVAARAGAVAPAIDFDQLLDQVNPVTHTLEQEFPVLCTNVRSSDWAPAPMLIALELSSFVTAPIASQGQTVGVVLVGSRQTPTPFAADDLELFTLLTNQLGVELESARLEDDLRRQARRLAALADATRRMTTALRVEDVVGSVLESLSSVVPYDSVTLWVRDGDELRIAAAQGFENDAERIGLRVSIADSALFGEMARTGGAIIVGDVRQDPHRFPAAEFQPTRSWLGAPLISKTRIIGALALDKVEPQAYSAPAGQALTAFANQAAIALDNARLFEEGEERAWELNARTQRLALLNRTSTELSGTLQVQRIYEIALTEVMEALTVEHAAVISFTADDQAVVDMERPAGGESHFSLRATLPALRRVRENLAPVAIEDVSADSLLADGHRELTRRGTKSLLVIPLTVGGTFLSALQIEEKNEARRFSPSEIELAQTLANQAAIALQNARLVAETQSRLGELSIINQLSRSISATINLRQIYETVCEQVCMVLGVSSAYLGRYDGPTDQLTIPFALEHDRDSAVPAHTPRGPDAHILRTRESVLLRGENIDEQLSILGAPPGERRAPRSYLGVPLTAGDHLIGVLAAQDFDDYSLLNEDHERILTTIAAQVSVAIENARLFGEARDRADELARRNERLAFLSRLAADLSASLDLSTILNQAAERVTQIFQVDHAEVALYDLENQFSSVEAEYPPLGALDTRMVLATDPLSHQVLARRTVMVGDVVSDPRLGEEARAALLALGIRSQLAVPLISQGRAIGSISLHTIHAPRQFSGDDVELAQTVAGQLAAAIANAQFARDLETRVAIRTNELQRERERVETLLQVTTELSSNLDLDRVLARALQLVTEAVGATQGSIFTIDLETEQVYYRAALGSPKVLPPGGELVTFGRTEGLVGWVIRNRQPVVIHNLDTDARWKKIVGQNVNHKSALAVPLMANEDVLGAMILYSPAYNAFNEDQLQLAAAAANQVGAASNNAELYRMIRDQAERLGAMLRGQQVEATKNRAILEGIADGVLVTDASGDVILFNSACERILGLARQDVVGRPITEFVGLYGAAGTAWLEAANRWSEDPTAYRPGEAFNERIELENKRIVLISLAPVLTGEEYLGSVSLIRDITREVEVDRLKSEFVTNVSHELRTPITPIKGYADMLLMGAVGPMPAAQAKFIEIIKNNAERLGVLVNDLLDISRIEAGQMELALQPFALRPLLANVVNMLNGRIDEEKKPVTLTLDVPDDLPLIFGDPERVTTILDNLVDNAFSYTHAGGSITIRARADEAAREMRIEVSDTGVGIPPEHQPRLFDRFFRGEDPLVLASAGTGLGLPIVRQLAEMNQGRVWLDRSAPGQGSTFVVVLPLADLREAEAG